MTQVNDYVDLFLQSNISKSPPFATFSVIFLAISRIFPIITLSPFFGSRILPHPVKVCFAFSLAIMCLPKLFFGVTESVQFDIRLVFLSFKEIFIGSIMGFFLGLPFQILTSAGVIIDHQRGAASLMTNDPVVQNQSSPIGTLYNFFLITMFYYLDGPFHVIDAILDSFEYLPPDKFLDSLFFAPGAVVQQKLVSALQIMVSLAIRFSAPALLSILMVDAFLGIINRLAPQVQITFLGMGLKSWLAILIVCVGWFALQDQLAQQIGAWLLEFKDLVRTFRISVA